jgi:radical SAM/Cys-rich protein
MTIGFHDRISETLQGPLTAAGINTLQVNAGYRCNMSCGHCHVNAGPARDEVMGKETADAVLSVLEENDIATLDITGGAPELSPHFRGLVTGAKKAGRHVIVRSNLTIFFEKGYEYLPEFYRELNIEISASLPCYLESGVDRARGAGTFEKSIRALRILNGLGYGDGTGVRKLNLVYNPSGAFLAPDQKALEADYRRELAARHGVSFDHLFVFANMPVGRFRTWLDNTGAYGEYMDKLEKAFNPATLDGLMCRHLLSIGWDGIIYDCDFNQMLGLTVQSPCPQNIADFDFERLRHREIRTGDHCYGCAAGQGST